MAVDPEPMRFCEMMVADHTKVNQKVNQKLAHLAGAKGMAVPSQVGPYTPFKLQRLAGHPCEEFDKCLVEAKFVAHKHVLAMFKAEAERGHDADVKVLAAKVLPKIQGHLDVIKSMAETMENPRAASPAN